MVRGLICLQAAWSQPWELPTKKITYQRSSLFKARQSAYSKSLLVSTRFPSPAELNKSAQTR